GSGGSRAGPSDGARTWPSAPAPRRVKRATRGRPRSATPAPPWARAAASAPMRAPSAWQRLERHALKTLPGRVVCCLLVGAERVRMRGWETPPGNSVGPLWSGVVAATTCRSPKAHVTQSRAAPATTEPDGGVVGGVVGLVHLARESDTGEQGRNVQWRRQQAGARPLPYPPPAVATRPHEERPPPSPQALRS